MHTHGDNEILVKKWIREIFYLQYWVPTIQTEPYPSYLYNFGGFTDGDRALALALEFTNPGKIIMFGFEFGKFVGKFSKPHLTNDTEASELKLRKLKFAKEFINELTHKWYKEHEIVIYSNTIKLNSLF
jgi:uncharacterized Rossmann fold enzyme